MKEYDSHHSGLIIRRNTGKRLFRSALLKRCAAFCIAMVLAAGSCLTSYASEQDSCEITQTEYTEPEAEEAVPAEENSGPEEEETETGREEAVPESQDNVEELFRETSASKTPAASAEDEQEEQDEGIIDIIRNPRNVKARLGETVVLSIEAEGDSLRYRWQWTFDGEEWYDCTEDGHDSPELRLVMTKDLDGCHYRCLVSSGEYTIESSEADIILSEAVDWALETGESGTILRFFGKGEMDSYDPEHLPWEDQADTITSVVVEEGVTSVSAYSCAGLSSLERIQLGSDVLLIDTYAFLNCTSLKYIKMYRYVDWIGTGAFRGCSSLEKIELPSSLTALSKELFADCTSLRSISLPSGLAMIGDSAFSGCESLETFTVPGKVTSIGDSAFCGCRGLSELVIPDSVKTIGGGCFTGCTSLRSITIPDSVTHLGTEAPVSLQGLTPSDPEDIQTGVFENCVRLTEVRLPAGLQELENRMFYSCRSLKTVQIPEGVNRIGDAAFKNCTSLQELALPQELKSIGADAFADCKGLKKFELPLRVESIGSNAFSGLPVDHLFFSAHLTDVDGRKLGLPDGASIFYGGTEDDFCTLFAEYISAGEEEDYSFFDRYYVFFELPDGPVPALSMEADIPGIVYVDLPETVSVEVLPADASCLFTVESDNPGILSVTRENGNYVLNGLRNGSSTVRVTMLDGSGLVFKKKVAVEKSPVKKKNKYTIRFHANGGTGRMKNLTGVPYRSWKVLTANTFKRKGYRFAGWNTKKDGSGDFYANKDKVISLTGKDKGTITLYAQWKKVKYTITYKLDGGINNEKNPSSYTISSTVSLKAPERPNYTFGGWYKDKKYKNKVTTIRKGSTGNRTLYAKWIPNKYIIVFDANGGAGKMNRMTGIAFDTAKPLEKNTFKKKGYSFTGWNTDPQGWGVAYADQEKIRGLTRRNGNTVTLYAQWKINEYTITYSLNAEDAKNTAANPVKYTVNDSFCLASPTRPGYVFDGWFSDSRLTKRVTEVSKGSTGNVTFYAKWTLNQ